MSQELEEIKSRLNIVDVISSYIKLEKAVLITEQDVLFMMKNHHLFLFLPQDRFGIVLEDVMRVEIFLSL
jgi:hypothetical protein